MPPPASRVRALDCHCSTGSRTHPWLHAATRFAGSRAGLPLFHGFADSPVATCRHPLRGFARWIATVPRVRGLTRGYMPPPASRVRAMDYHCSTGSRTHPWLHAATRFAGSRDGLHSVPRVRGLTRDYMPPPASRVRAMDCTLFHGFADSPVATCRHPLRGFARWIATVPRVRGLTRGYMPPPASRVRAMDCHCSTGSRTHPWLHAATRFAGSRAGLHSVLTIMAMALCKSLRRPGIRHKWRNGLGVSELIG